MKKKKSIEVYRLNFFFLYEDRNYAHKIRTLSTPSSLERTTNKLADFSKSNVKNQQSKQKNKTKIRVLYNRIKNNQMFVKTRFS